MGGPHKKKNNNNNLHMIKNNWEKSSNNLEIGQNFTCPVSRETGLEPKAFLTFFEHIFALKPFE